MGSTEAGSVSPAFDAFRRGWETEFGADFPLPAFSPATTGDFRVRSRAARVDDVAITDIRGVSAIRTEGPTDGAEDLVRMYVVQQGAWTLGGSDEPGELTVPAFRSPRRDVSAWSTWMPRRSVCSLPAE